MSPRSAEFREAARRRLRLARGAVDDDPAGALSAAYYATLYAARALLSERDVHARTHGGTWHELRRLFVDPGLLDGELVGLAQGTQPLREKADYDAWQAPTEAARDAIDVAERFLAAIDVLLD